MPSAPSKSERLLKTRRPLPRWLYAGVARLACLWARTFRVSRSDPAGRLETITRDPSICVIWHNRLLFLPACFSREERRRVVVLASESRDGEHAAKLMEAFGFTVERGSTSRGGQRALLRLKRHLAHGRTVVLTVDGPRGPRYSVHPGAAVLAAVSGRPIVPLCLNAPHRWELSSWDRTQFPKPFSKTYLVAGAPLRLPPETRRAPADACTRIREALLEITADEPPLPPADPRNWRFSPNTPDSIRSFLVSGAWVRALNPVKRNRVRQVYRIAPGPAPNGLYLKFERPRGVAHRFLRRIFPKALDEYRALEWLEAHGVAGVQPIAWCRAGNGSFLVTQDAGEVQTLLQAWRTVRENPERRRVFLDALAAWQARINALHLDFADLHGSNLLVRNAPVEIQPEFLLVDVAGMRRRRKPLPPHRTLLWLMPLLLDLPPGERSHLLVQSGCCRSNIEARREWPRLFRRHNRRSRTIWPGRRKRWLHQSSLCVKFKIREPKAKGLLARNSQIPGAILARLLAAALGAPAAPPETEVEILKNGPKRRVVRAATTGVSIIVKEYRLNCRRRGPLAPDRRAWLAHLHVALFGIPVPDGLAWLRQNHGAGVIAMQDAGRKNLAEAAPAALPAARRRMLAAAGILLARLYLAGVRHRDLKPSNVLVAPSPFPRYWRASLVDLDSIRYGARGSRRFLRRNLAQIEESMPAQVTDRDMLYLFAACRRETGLPRRAFRCLLPSGFAARKHP